MRKGVVKTKHEGWETEKALGGIVVVIVEVTGEAGMEDVERAIFETGVAAEVAVLGLGEAVEDMAVDTEAMVDMAQAVRPNKIGKALETTLHRRTRRMEAGGIAKRQMVTDSGRLLPIGRTLAICRFQVALQ